MLSVIVDAFVENKLKPARTATAPKRIGIDHD